MNIETINDFLLPPTLFIGYLFAISLFFRRQRDRKLATESDVSLTTSNLEDLISVRDVEEIYPRAEKLIGKLNKRQSRKICSPLKIKQKRRGIDKRLYQVKREIETAFERSPRKVIAAIAKRLPELYSTRLKPSRNVK